MIPLPPKRPLRRNKVQSFLSDDDYAKLRQIAASLKEDPGAIASRVLSTFVSDCAHLAEESRGAS